MAKKPKRPVGLSEGEFDEYRFKDFLRFWRLPWGMWILSFFCFSAGAFLISCFLYLEILDHRTIEMWQVLIIVSFLGAALALFSIAKIEVVSFDKEERVVTKSKWILFYNIKSFQMSMDEVSDINLVLNGIEEKYSSTLYYKILIVRKLHKPVKLLETKSRSKAIDKALKIRAFFGMKGKIPLQDESITKED